MEKGNPHNERKESYLEYRRLYVGRYGEDFPRVVINVGDVGSKEDDNRMELSMTYPKDRPEKKRRCLPDWTFWHWPSSRIQSSIETFRQIEEAGEASAEVEKVAWFGNMQAAGPDVPEHRTRHMLVNHFGVQHPFRFDFKHAGAKAHGSRIYISLPDMVRKYRWLLDIGGAGYSGRTKFLLFSGRPLLMVERRYLEYFSEELKPWEHYIPVRENLSDLINKHEWLKHNDEEALKIAKRAKDYAIRNFTIEKVIERFREVFLDLNDMSQGASLG